MSSMKVKAKEKDGIVEVKALIKHPMETGLRKDQKTGKPIPAHFVQEVVVEHGGKTRITADWSGACSPFSPITHPHWIYQRGACGSYQPRILSRHAVWQGFVDRPLP